MDDNPFDVIIIKDKNGGFKGKIIISALILLKNW